MNNDLRFVLFKEHMNKTTDKLLKEYNSFKGQNAITLKIFSDIVFHLTLIDIGTESFEKVKRSSLNYYNSSYKTIERLYIGYLETLIAFKKFEYKR